MCVLCGELITQTHWTDTLAHDSPDSVRIVGDEHQRNARRTRNYRVQILNSLVTPYGIQVRDWNGVKYLISDRKGYSELVTHLGEVWTACEKLLHHRIDPLDQQFIESLKSRRMLGDKTT